MRRLVSVLIGFLLLWPVHAQAANWTTRGNGEDRTQVSTESLGAITIDSVAWNGPVNTGATGSQPVVVGQKLYHLARQSLWEIDLMTGAPEEIAAGLGILDDGTSRPSTSSIAYAEIRGEPRLYFGTCSNALCVISLKDYDLRCHRLDPNATPRNWVSTPSSEAQMVTTPLVKVSEVGGQETDFVVLGDKQGRLWVFQGFGLLDSPYRWQHWDVGGWLLASMVQVAPLTFVWGNTEGRIQAYSITPGVAGLSPGVHAYWGSHVQTPGQVADGFAAAESPEGNMVYALDSVGNLLRINSATGRYYTAHLANISFTNTSPAIDDKHIYLSIRQTTKGKGALIAVDRATFQEVWRKDLDYPANTNPLVLTVPGAVLVGDCDHPGRLHPGRAELPRIGVRTTASDRSYEARHVDFERASHESKELGTAGEQLVLSYERQAHVACGRRDLAEKVEHTSVVRGDGAGYDIRSFSPDGKPKYIEVKTTTRGPGTSFMMSANELAFAEDHLDQYWLYRIYHFDQGARFFKLSAAQLLALTFDPVQFRVSLSRPQSAN